MALFGQKLFPKNFSIMLFTLQKVRSKAWCKVIFCQDWIFFSFFFDTFGLEKKDKNMIYFEDKYFIISILSLDFQKCLIKNSTWKSEVIS